MQCGRLVEMPLWGCDREQGGSAPNAVKNSSSPFRGSLAETSVCRAAIRSREAVAHLLELEPNFRITEWATRTRLAKLQIFIDGLRKAGLPE
jgi:hypothetical protein